MANCFICKKELSLIEGYSEEENRFCEKCWKKKKGIPFENLEEKYKQNPSLKRLAQLKSSKFGTIITIILSLCLIVFGIFNGYFEEGMFLISLEFILGIVFLIIGVVRNYSINEKIKDLELDIAKHKRGNK